MGAVCCRCHNASGFEDAVVRLPAPLSVSMSASERLLAVDHPSRLTNSNRALSMSAAASPSASSARVPLSQSLASYVSFPFPFVKKPKPARRRSSRRGSGIWGVMRGASLNDCRSRNQAPDQAQALAYMPYVGDYWRRSAAGALVPLSLLELCVRRVCAHIVDEDNVDAAVELWLPTELAAHALAWLKKHSLLEKHAFRVLARSLLHEWDLSDQDNVRNNWFDELPREPMTHLSSLDLTGCAMVTRLGSAAEFPRLTNLVKVSFHGCTDLDVSAVDMLRYSPKLTSVDLAGCINVDDKSLQSLSCLDRLRKLDLSGCRLLSDEGFQSLYTLDMLESLSLSRCSGLTDDAFVGFSKAYPRLKQLDCARCRIGVRAMEFVGRVHSLEKLVIRGCSQVFDDAMESLAELSNLKYFDARHCDMLHTIPTTWKNIEVLLLSFTGFGESDAAVLLKYPNLVELDVRKCRLMKRYLHSIRGFEFISQATQLERLGLAETGLNDPDLKNICKRLHNLRALNISSTEISDAGTEGLASLSELRVLHMDTAGVTNRSLANLSFLSHLERLDVFGAGITDSGLTHLMPLMHLKELDLCSGSISDRGVEIISKIKTLTSLNLAHNRNIRAKSLFHIRMLTNLRSLNLSNTGITALSLRHLYPLKDLRVLSVYGCTLSQSHIDILREILPELRCLRCA